MSDSICLKSVQELQGMNFFIPSYQRGYRWTKQQVEDLLDDIWEFSQAETSSFYCLQPLVVKKLEINEEKKLEEVKNKLTLRDIRESLKEQWEVIDGQQRLTTIYLILAYLLADDEPLYIIDYETRRTTAKSDDKQPNITNRQIGSDLFLRNFRKKERICLEKSTYNIDFHHMDQAFEVISNWFKEEKNGDTSEDKEVLFKDTLLNRTQFIWYCTDENDPIKVFTRLNINKIALTDSELIKVLFLNRSNFEKSDSIYLQQLEIATEWDRIEATLQNDEFWYFIHGADWSKPTRIDFIFDLIQEMDFKLFATNGLFPTESQKTSCLKDDAQMSISLKEILKEGELEKILGNDEHKTFRYFNALFKNQKDNLRRSEYVLRDSLWKEIRSIFQTFIEWYSNLQLYHYVGYLISNDIQTKHILEWWRDKSVNYDTRHEMKDQNIEKLTVDKICFVNKLKQKIREVIGSCNNLASVYDIDTKERKAKIRPLLLLYNIQTVINQNVNQKKSYDSLSVFYKFPFHLYKKENWDIEHIDSNTENELSDKTMQNEYLLCYYNVLDAKDDSELRNNIKCYIENKEADKIILRILGIPYCRNFRPHPEMTK